MIPSFENSPPGAPLNSMGEPCPWPYDPLLIVMGGPVPLGMYHCPACGDMVVAGVPHPDFRGQP